MPGGGHDRADRQVEAAGDDDDGLADGDDADDGDALPMFSRLVVVRKYGDTTDSTMNSRTSMSQEADRGSPPR